MYVCWDVHQDTYLDIWVRRVIIIKDANYGSVVCFAEFASIGFYIGFPVLWLLYYTCSHPALPLVFHFSSLMFLSYHTMNTSCLISPTRFSMHDYDSVLSIHMCLSLHAIWLSPHHSLGEFWLLWILMSRSWSLELGDLLAEDQAYFCGADRPAVAPVPSLLPLVGSRLLQLFRERPFVLFIHVHLFVFSHLRLSVM